MTEMAAAIIVVSLPALKSLLRRRGEGSTGRSYGRYGGGTGGRSTDKSSHAKLSSGRDPYVVSARVASAEDSGSEVELNQLGRNVIYKTARVSVTYQTRDDQEADGRQSSPQY